MPDPTSTGLVRGEDKVCRCWWGVEPSIYRDYHDREWGWPVAEDSRLFEKLCLEGFQSGLSWLTILKKRENFRRAFSEFRFDEVARFGERDVERLMQDAGIVRHRGKILSAINNARRAGDIVGEFGSLASYIWRWEPKPEERPTHVDLPTLQTISKSATSLALSKDLKRRGWSFVGPTTIYAFMQAMGLVNDHLEGCDVRPPIEKARRKFRRP